ncbi:MAG: LemA family protein [Candidatus Aenigmarchaeota archaeon]|nr:LemA family protein [Candidatus Aenigmarchaeota archaeon]
MIWLIGLIIFVVLVTIYYANRIMILGNRVDNAWSQIDVQLKKRADLVPNLVETVKGYMKHEKEAIKAVTKARERMMKAGSDEDRVKANNQMTGALKTIFALSENYPKLRANENFMMLQEELSAVENKIAYARQFYNDSILTYNNLVTTFPGSIFASILGKKKKKHLEIEASERKAVKVDF